MWLLNFNLQSKVIPSNFYEVELVILKFPNFRKFWSCLFNRTWHLPVFNLFDYHRTKLKVYYLFLLKLRLHLLYCLWPQKACCHLFQVIECGRIFVSSNNKVFKLQQLTLNGYRILWFLYVLVTGWTHIHNIQLLKIIGQVSWTYCRYSYLTEHFFLIHLF